MKLQVTLLFIVCTCLCFAQNTNKKYEKDNYSITYPSNWELNVSGQMNSTFILFSELEKEDTFRENINLLVQDLTDQEMTIESYGQITKSQIKEQLPGSKILESSFDKEKNRYIMIWSGNVGSGQLKFKQYFFIKKEKVYILTFTTTPEVYNDYIELGNEILNSFTLN